MMGSYVWVWWLDDRFFEILELGIFGLLMCFMLWLNECGWIIDGFSVILCKYKIDCMCKLLIFKGYLVLIIVVI